MAKKVQTFRRYSLELKLEAARLVNEEHMSIREVATRLDIQNKSQVQVWAAKVKRGISLEPATSKRGRLEPSFPVWKKKWLTCGRRLNIMNVEGQEHIPIKVAILEDFYFIRTSSCP
ncbi:transposase [Paenibacillus sp. FSL R5-0486]|uniref:transposase n=1 Tax=Paenibacillus sp. FSL R5-0486 TaxID=2921645 RepID=UPI0030DA3F06